MLAYFINKRFNRAPSPTVSAAGAAMMMRRVLADPKPLLQPEFSNPKLEPEPVRACVAPRRSLLRSFSMPNAAVQPWMGQALWLHPAAVCHAMRHCSTVVPAAVVYSAFNVSAVLQVHFHYVELTFEGGNGSHTGWMLDKRRGDDRLRPIGTLTRGGWRIHVYFDDERAKFLFLFAGRLAALTDGDPPVCIGLTGTVGVGKTHLLVMLSVAMGLGQLDAVLATAAAHAPAQTSTSMPNLQPQLVLCILFPNAGTWMREQDTELVRAVSVGLEMLYVRLHGDPRQASIMQQALTAVLKAGRHNLRHDMTVDDFLTAWNPANVATVRAVADAANAAAGVPPQAASPTPASTTGTTNVPPVSTAATAAPSVATASSTEVKPSRQKKPLRRSSALSKLTAAIQQLGTGLQKLDAKIDNVKNELKNDLQNVKNDLRQLDAKIENIASSMRRRNPGNFFAAVFQALADLRSKEKLRVVIVVDQVNTLFAQQARDPESANPIISFLSRPEGCHMLFQSASANNEGWQLLGAKGVKPFDATPSVPLDGKLEMFSLAAPTKVPKLYVNEVQTANGLDPNLFTEKVEGALLSLGNNYLSLYRLVQYMAMNPDRQSLLPEQLVFQAVTSLQTDIELSMAEFLRKLSQPQLHRCTDIYFDLRHGLPVDLRDSDHGLLDKRYVNIAPSSTPAGVAASTQSTSAMTLQHRCSLSQAAAMKVVWSFMRHASSIRGMSDGFQYEELFVRCLHHVLGPHDAPMRPRSELYCVEAVPTTADMQRVLQSDDFVNDGFAVLRPAASARDVDLYLFLKQRDALVITVVQTTVMPVAHSQAAYAAYKASQAADSASQQPLHPPSHESFFTRTKDTLLKNVPSTLGSVKIEFLYVLGTPLVEKQVSPLTITRANVSEDPPSSGLIMTRKVRGLQSYSGLLEKDNADVLHLRRPAKSTRRAQSGKYHRIDKQDFATLTHVRNFPNVLVVRVLLLKLARLQRLSDSMHAPYQSHTGGPPMDVVIWSYDFR